MLELHDVSDALPFLSSQMPRSVAARELVASMVEHLALYSNKVFKVSHCSVIILLEQLIQVEPDLLQS